MSSFGSVYRLILNEGMVTNSKTDSEVEPIFSKCDQWFAIASNLNILCISKLTETKIDYN
jgi:hypothetical protein